MKAYQEEFARILAESGALFFRPGLRLKDGRPTPYFVNMGLFRTGRLVNRLGALLADMIVAEGLHGRVDILLGPSYKGSALAVAAAMALWERHGLDLLFDYDRKEAKTHGEATGAARMFVTGAFFEGARLLVVDDVGTTMATKYELLEKVEAQAAQDGMGVEIAGVALAVDREQTTAVRDEQGRLVEGVKGLDALAEFTRATGAPVSYLAGIRGIVNFLAEKGIPVMVDGAIRPLGAAEVKAVEAYLEVYGAQRS